MKHLKLNITETDILTAEKFKISNPILFVLQCVTGTFWRIQDEGVLQETIAPYRICSLTTEALTLWREYSRTGQMLPCEIELKLSGSDRQSSTLAGSYIAEALRESRKLSQ